VNDEILFGELSRTAAVDGKAIALAPPDPQAAKHLVGPEQSPDRLVVG
jgi:hypothetical protein